jgi:hypothetical protein
LMLWWSRSVRLSWWSTITLHSAFLGAVASDMTWCYELLHNDVTLQTYVHYSMDDHLFLT